MQLSAARLRQEACSHNPGTLGNAFIAMPAQTRADFHLPIQE
jgi:hypothetical protein